MLKITLEFGRNIAGTIDYKYLLERGLRIRSRYRYSFYDSLIIAAALKAGCRDLYSEDLQDGQRIEQLTIKNPFRD